AESFGLLNPIGLYAAWGLPVREITIAIGLFVQQLFSSAAFLASGLLMLFAIVLTFELLSGRRVKCACFGTLTNSEASGWTVARNVVLSVLAAAGGTMGLPESGDRSNGPTTVVVALMGVSIVAVAVAIMLGFENRSLRTARRSPGVL